VEAALIAHFGHRPQRASVSFVGVDPIEVLRFEPVPGERAYVTLGMSRHPMTGAAESIVTSEGPRAELMLHLRDPIDDHADVWRRLAVLAAAPAVEGVVYAPGMTADLGEPFVAGSACTGVVVRESAVSEVAADDNPVSVFEVVAATSTELAWCRVRGSDALSERWAANATDLMDILRRPVGLD
jgi:Suppressor of fused protein (SUFU)